MDRATLTEHSNQRSEKSVRDASELPDLNEHKNESRRLNN